MKGALDEIIAVLKSDLSDVERRSEVESLIGKVTNDEFNALMVLGQCLVDYQAPLERAPENQTEEV
jgi:hypothetical protein